MKKIKYKPYAFTPRKKEKKINNEDPGPQSPIPNPQFKNKFKKL